MIKVPCGGFKLDENFLGMNENDELSLTGGGSEGKAYQQLFTDGNGEVRWGALTLPVVFTATDDSSSATIKCPYGYEELRRYLETHNFLIMSGQLYIESLKTLCTMVECIQKTDWLEFLFVVPQDAGDGLVIGTILTVYYLEDGTITFTRPVV